MIVDFVVAFGKSMRLNNPGCHIELLPKRPNILMGSGMLLIGPQRAKIWRDYKEWRLGDEKE